jgi:hypothetical protein
MDYLEFIARVTSHIPDKGQVMVRYYGFYANAHRGKVRKAGQSPFALRLAEAEVPAVPYSLKGAIDGGRDLDVLDGNAGEVDDRDLAF